MNILEALWGGDIRPSERTVRRGTEYARLQDAALRAYDRFWAMLSEDQKEAYKTLADLDMERTAISDADIFNVFPDSQEFIHWMPHFLPTSCSTLVPFITSSSLLL